VNDLYTLEAATTEAVTVRSGMEPDRHQPGTPHAPVQKKERHRWRERYQGPRPWAGIRLLDFQYALNGPPNS
jgi:hypothetical protein